MPTLLITDDQEGVLATLGFVLSQHGARVLLAKSGAIALGIFESEMVDVALIDLCMPVMDGITLCRKLRQCAADQGRDLPVWMMTAAHTNSAVLAAQQAGAIALLKKPFECSELLRQMESAVSGHLATPPLLAERTTSMCVEGERSRSAVASERAQTSNGIQE